MTVPPIDPSAARPVVPRPDQIRAAREFEAVFAGQLAQLMLSEVAVDPEFGGGHGEEMFRGVLAEELGRSIAAGGTLGLAPAVLAVLQRLEGEGR